jgi:hypothetical protein
MASDRVRRSRLMRAMYPDTSTVVWLVCGWVAVAAVVQLAYLFTVLPSIDGELVLYLSGRPANGPVRIQLSASAGAIISSVLLIVGAGVAAGAFVLLRAKRRAAYGMAVVALAIVASSVALLVAGFVAALHNDAITGPGLWGGLPALSAGVVFFSQLPFLIRRSTGKRVQVQ